MNKALFILGAPDDEMNAIQEILDALHVPYMLALDEAGRRVSAGSENKVSIGASVIAHSGQDNVTTKWRDNSYTHIFWVECTPIQLHEQWIINNSIQQIYIGHHHPDNANYASPPKLFWSASSLGQVINYLQYPPLGLQILDKNILDINVIIQPRAWLLEHIAAADHCLRAAYRGECPGILPVSMRMWRLMSNSKRRQLSIDFCVQEQRREIDDILALPNYSLGEIPDSLSLEKPYIQIKDATELKLYNVSELAYILNMSIMYRHKNFICITNAEPWVIDLWIERYANGKLTDIYKDYEAGTARGFKLD